MSDVSAKLPEPVPARPQFCLRTLFGGVTLCGGLFALMAALGPVWSAVLLMSLSLVAAHVIGNSLGCRLRDAAAREIAARDPSPTATNSAPSLPVPVAGRLRQRTAISRWAIGTAAAGSVCGAIGGCLLLAWVVGPRATLPALALGTVSSGVLGGFAGFLAASFCGVFFRALAEALADSAPRPRPTPRRWSGWLRSRFRRSPLASDV